MARKVFFSFHFKRDSRKVAQIRNAFVIGNYEKPPFLDAVEWEKIERAGSASIKKWIDNNLHGTSVTIVLIGYETARREWVLYEIEESYKRNNGLLGITIHNINDPLTGSDYPGLNPFSYVKDRKGSPLSLSIPIYDWVNNNGKHNIASWIEEAARVVNR